MTTKNTTNASSRYRFQKSVSSWVGNDRGITCDVAYVSDHQSLSYKVDTYYIYSNDPLKKNPRVPFIRYFFVFRRSVVKTPMEVWPM